MLAAVGKLFSLANASRIRIWNAVSHRDSSKAVASGILPPAHIFRKSAMQLLSIACRLASFVLLTLQAAATWSRCW